MRSRRAEVPQAVDRVLRAAAAAALSTEQRDNLAVAMAEALSNAAVHGNRLRNELVVTVIVRVDGGTVEIEVTDQGEGFDANGLEDPTEPERLLTPGGRGVFLMRRLVDEVHYNERGNVVRLVVRGGG